MDTWDWATFYRNAPDFGWAAGLSPAMAGARFLRFYLATSAVYDTFRAAGNVAMVMLLGLPVITSLDRFRWRFSLELLPARDATAASAPPVLD
jgi:hypothetical protein